MSSVSVVRKLFARSTLENFPMTLNTEYISFPSPKNQSATASYLIEIMCRIGRFHLYFYEKKRIRTTSIGIAPCGMSQESISSSRNPLALDLSGSWSSGLTSSQTELFCIHSTGDFGTIFTFLLWKQWSYEY